MTDLAWTWRDVRLQAAALLVAVAILLGGGLVAGNQIGASINQMIAATASARLQAASAQSILSALQDAEAGARGYLLTGRLYYLEPYYTTIGRVEELLKTLETRARGVPWLEEEQARLSAAAREKVAELRRTVVIAQRDGLDAARAEVMTDAGKTHMDGVRTSALRILERGEAERAQRAALLQREQQRVTNLLVGGLSIGVLVVAGVVLLLLWNLDRLRRARAGELRQSARLAAAIEHVPDGVAVFDADGRMTLVNSRFGPTLELPPALAQAGVRLDAVAAATTLDPPLLSGHRPAEPRSSEARHGPRTLEVWRSPMPDGGQMLAVADVTRRVAAEEVARQAQKMDVLGQMTGGVAHDFNNLLQVVSANLELVRGRVERSGGDATVLSRLDAASAGVARGAKLTRHLLAFARRQPLAPEPLDPARLLMGMEDVLRRTLGESLALELVIGGGLWAMRADPTQFENALLNLTLNARDAMAGADGVPSGKITIEAANAALDESDAARAADVTPGQYVMFAVTDTGAGMTAAQIARAAEPFYTTKPDGRGTGLGLSMVLGFAKQSGGHFQLYSEPGKGTTARLYIPRTNASAAPPEPVMQQVPTGHGELVLIVEDDAPVRQAAREAVQGLGYQVIEADSADAGLLLLEAGARPRVLFTDVVMPGKATARQLAERARALVPGIAVLFTSGYTQNSIVHDGQLDADVTLISKPWRADDLARALHSVLTGGGVRPPPRRRVLLVEDEELVRVTTADALAELGFDVLEAGSAAAALARLNPAPDLMLTDLGLPDQDGLELIRQARLLLPDLPVVIVSGQSVAPEKGMVWLPKPYDFARLNAAVQDALSRAKAG